MKSVGLIRHINKLGRIVIPIELRRTLAMEEATQLEIYVEDEEIILKKYEMNGACLVTGKVSNENISLANGKITLSPEGLKYLINELEKTLVK
ncbi:AbrB family transcriptional regulator (plasmid) [Bacillus sp. N447-1]|uniref:AbrB/MazE/SpoVT family DNA-binding domain-containing protein n=1 Tax=Bacillus sp. N447-1 TaxID=2789208 RepID=UPI001F6043AF|nr:AbrB/MazE/SpoVT family DNA-binding domain-containing protein [Bacillus sp. N447-1]UNT71657.1 AbrB family transcriptional regulator [Bacillus sp. N447-1]